MEDPFIPCSSLHPLKVNVAYIHFQVNLFWGSKCDLGNSHFMFPVAASLMIEGLGCYSVAMNNNFFQIGQKT